MDRPRCPGQDMRSWRPEDIFEVACPSCGAEIEFWKDEPFRSCSVCSLEVQNPRVDLGCAIWCQFAEECLGSERAASVVAALMRDRLVAEVREACGGDSLRLDRAMQLLEKAEQLIAAEGGEALVVKAAALLRDIDDRNAESVAGAILERLGVDARTRDRVCRIIESLHDDGAAAEMNALEARILRDAQRLVSLSRGSEATGADERVASAADGFETAAGRTLAGEILLRRNRDPAS